MRVNAHDHAPHEYNGRSGSFQPQSQQLTDAVAPRKCKERDVAWIRITGSPSKGTVCSALGDFRYLGGLMRIV
jgi:hypothetical protein